MKLFLSALFATVIAAPMSFAEGCEKGKCDKEKKESTVMAAGCDCNNCESKKCADCDKCKKDDKKEEGALADNCGKCKKGGEKKEEGTLV